MIPLIKLKREVQFNGEFTKVIDVMKGIAAARYYLLERQLALFERFSKAVEDVLSVTDVRGVTHPFLQAHSAATGVIFVTTDAGFLGGLNLQVIARGLHEAGADGVLTVIGERGAGTLRDMRKPCEVFPGIDDTHRAALAHTVATHVVGQVLSGVCGRLVVAYPKALSFSSQEVTVETLLPCSAWLPPCDEARARAVLWESRPDEVLEYVIALWLGHRLEEIFAISRLAEMGARAVHLEGSYQELLRQGKKLKWQYHRGRHEVIDRSMREIFSAQLLYRRLNEA